MKIINHRSFLRVLCDLCGQMHSARLVGHAEPSIPSKKGRRECSRPTWENLATSPLRQISEDFHVGELASAGGSHIASPPCRPSYQPAPRLTLTARPRAL
jgi:hypothetical protein